jgi:hypothetical protein
VNPEPRAAHPRTKEAWREFCARTPPPRPDPEHTPAVPEYKAWPGERREEFNAVRHRCHANPPFIITPQVTRILELLRPKLLQGHYAQDGGYEYAVFNGPAYCGKTTLLKMIGKQYELDARAAHLERAEPGLLKDWAPVVYVSASTGATARQLSQAIAKFLHVPVNHRNANKWMLTDPVLDALATSGTELLLLDDLHMLDKIRDGGQESNDHIKNLANHAAVTIIGAGILLENGNLFTDGRPPTIHPPTATGHRRGRGRAAQFGARFSDIQHLAPFDITTPTQQRAWMALVRQFEANLLLLDHPTDSLTRDHWRYLHQRTSGYIGSLASLFKQAAHHAVDTGIERLEPDILDQLIIDHDAEVEYAGHSKPRTANPTT